VSDHHQAQRAHAPACTRCHAAMSEILSIAPTLHEPGLIAYECPNCGYLTSLIVHPPNESSSRR
jgi:hypothetical protein